MKKAFIALLLVFAAFAGCWALWPAAAVDVNVLRTIPAGGTMWEAVDTAMTEVGDHRQIEEVMYYTRQANPGINVGAIQPGTVITIPCKVRGGRR